MEKTKEKPLIIDAEGQVLGRLATKIASFLRSKDKPSFLPYKKGVRKVFVYNTNKLKITGKKLEQKRYYHHSGYPGGLREEVMKDVMAKDSSDVLRRAVYGMLPSNKLRKDFLKNLTLFKEEIPK